MEDRLRHRLADTGKHPGGLPHRQPARPDRPGDGQPQRAPGPSSCSRPRVSRRGRRRVRAQGAAAPSTAARRSGAGRTTWWRRCATAATGRWPGSPAATRVVIDGDDISARLVVQTARQSRLSVDLPRPARLRRRRVLPDRPSRGWSASRSAARCCAYRQCCPVGMLHADGTTELNPPMETVIGPNDQLVILAEDDSAVKLAGRPFDVDPTAIVHSVRGPQAPERTLMLGWNGRAVRIIEQLDVYVAAGSAVDIVTDRADADMVGRPARRSGCATLTVRLKDGDIRDRNVLESLDVGRVQQRHRALRRPARPADGRLPGAGDAAAPARHAGQARPHRHRSSARCATSGTGRWPS